jgi:hypothetical protein
MNRPHSSLSTATLLLATLLIAQSAQAVTITSAKTTDTATVASCKSGAYKDCKSTAHVNKATPLAGNDANFKAGFDAWNKGNAADKQWSLVNGGALPGGDFTVSSFGAKADANFGGMNIIIDWSYTGADKSNYLWSQGLSLNYTPGDGAGSTPAATSSPALDTDRFNKLNGCNNKDTAANWSGARNLSNYFCGPAYPYQTGDRQMGDGPQGAWPDSSFEAYAFVSKIDTAARKLTIYEGVQYGFQLSATAVPEPAAWAMALVGVMVVRRVRRALPLRA